MIHIIYLPLTGKPETGIHVTYIINAGMKTPFVTGIYHSMGPVDGPVIMTDMKHMIMDVMTNPIFKDLQVMINTKIQEKI